MGAIMAEMSNYNHAEFCWLDLASSDLSKSKEFYAYLFGWESFEMPVEDAGGYGMFTLNHKPVTGYYPLMKEQIEMNIPSHWMSYIKTDDIASTVNLIKENGGKIIVDVQNVPTQGSMALAHGPDGGLFGLWQPENHFGSAYKQEHGSMCWFEYGCRDREGAIKFFEAVFGWQSNTSPMGENLYTTFFIENNMIAGLYELPENMNDVPNHWLPYFEIADLDKALEIVSNNNGVVIMGKLFVEGVGDFAVIQDPIGAVSGLIQSSK